MLEPLESLESAMFTGIVSKARQTSDTRRQEDVGLTGLDTDDLHMLRAWNAVAHQASESRVHDLIESHMKARPQALAIDAWDGQFTYDELDRASSRLAEVLYDSGVKQESLVLVHLDKSCWTPIAILGIIRAGGAFVLLDSSHQLPRWKEISQAVKAPIIITSLAKQEEAALLADTSLFIDELLQVEAVPSPEHWRASPVGPENALYVVFTSGSTGKPKGVVVEHRSLCTTAQATAEKEDIGPGVRFLQFASYAFDQYVFDHLKTLISGACICIPSAVELRDDLVGAINRFGVTGADLTPSVTRLLSTDEVPTLRIMVVGGEGLSEADRERWHRRVRLTNEYGPAECAVACISRPDVSASDSASNVGFPRGCVCWIVDPEDHNKLLPLGTVGELCIEGPVVARGYLNDSQRTQESFIENPTWMRHFRGSDQQHRMYKTGDLARYTSDGSIEVIGRKDRQVKLRGQRIELGEVEHHVKKHFPTEMVLIEAITPLHTSTPMLVAFIRPSSQHAQQSDDLLFAPITERFRAKVQTAEAQLKATLPPFLVPSAFVEVLHIPLNASGKLNIRALRDKASNMSCQDLSAYSTETKDKAQPTNEVQRHMQSVWAQVLQIRPDEIGINDSFLQIGGDSLLAMRVVRQCRNEGIPVSVANLLRYRTIEQLVKQVENEHPQATQTNSFHDVPGLDLLHDQDLVARVINQTGRDDIEDIIPCFPVQQGILLSEAKMPNSYQNRLLWEVHGKDAHIAPDPFKALSAWERIVNCHPMLRTAFIEHKVDDGTGYVQVQFRRSPMVVPIEKCDQVPELEDTDQNGPENAILCAPWSMKLYELPNQRLFCELTISHALIDGASVELLVEQLQLLYHGTDGHTSEASPFRKYYQILRSSPREPMLNYWTRYLDGVDPCIFPTDFSAKAQQGTRSVLRTESFDLPLSDTLISTLESENLTLFNLIQVAWGLTLRSYTGSDSVCFGYMTSGRDQDVEGIENAIGPFITMLISRMSLVPDLNILQALRNVQEDFLRSISHQHCSLADILDSIDMSGQQSLFNSLITFQRHSKNKSGDAGVSLRLIDEHEPTEYPLILHVDIKEDSVSSYLMYWPSVLSEDTAANTMRTFTQVIGDIGAKVSGSIGDLDLLNPDDRTTIFARNTSVPSQVDLCVHDLVQKSVSRQPHRPAVCGYDGSFSYEELWQKAARFSHYLVHLGVGPGSMVPVCFPRSTWTIVCMLAILKAGGCCVPVECDHPPERIQAALQELHPSIILCLSDTQSLVDKLELPSKTITVTEDLLSPSESSVCRHDQPQLSDPAFLLFTSGSTGVPKGIIMDHGAVSSSMLYHGPACKVGPETRALQFSSYAFDVSIYEIFTTLTHGGCVCVPSAFERSNDLSQAIERYQANWTFLTPSVLRILSPKDVPSLEVVVAGGEAVAQDLVETWVDNVQFFNGYGPAECTICTVHSFSTKSESSIIGKMTGGVGWVVDTNDINRLVPDGTVGELLVEGPVVSCGYLNRPQETAKAFVDAPRWLQDFRQGPSSRLFRTGDLVRCSKEGTLEFVKRKTNQVKIRGQRVELEEVEVHIRRQLLRSQDVVVAILHPHSSPLMAAFIGSMGATKDHDICEISHLEPSQEQFSFIRSRLQETLPKYMVPDVFLPVSCIPLTATGKADRRLLIHMGSKLTRQELGGLRGRKPASAHKSSPETVSEGILRALFAEVLKLETEDVNVNDHFFHLGGDSLRAMRLVASARAKDLRLSVVQVFQNPILCDLARQTESSASTDITPRGSPDAIISLRDAFLKSSHISGLPLPEARVSDVFPTTYFQSVMASQPKNYWSMQFSQDVDVVRMRTAFEKLVQHHPMLRSIFVPYEGRMAQVVLDSTEVPLTRLQIDSNLDMQSQVNHFDQDHSDFPLVHCLVTGTAPTTRNIVMRLSRAQHDRMCFPMIIHDLLGAYLGKAMAQPTDFAKFLAESASRVKESQSFWKHLLTGSSMTNFGNGMQTNGGSSQIQARRVVPCPKLPEGATIATVVKAAWSLVLSRFTGQTDVVFGQIVNGRSSLDVADPQHIFGPCVNISPVRVDKTSHSSFTDLLHNIQQQHIQSLPHETLGLDEICRAVGWSHDTIFGSVVDHVDSRDLLEVRVDDLECKATRYSPEQPEFSATRVWVVSEQDGEDLHLTIESTEDFLPMGQARQLVEHMGNILRVALARHSQPISNVGLEAFAPVNSQLEALA